MPPFQTEGAERKRVLGRPSQTQSQSSRNVPFGEEGEEGSSKRPKTRQNPKPFGKEESEGSDSDNDSGEFVPQGTGSSSSIFSLGWNTMMNLEKAQFYKKQDKPIKKKRQYNNSQREAAAAKNTNRRNINVFASRGADPERVSNLLGQSCQCALFQTKLFFCHGKLSWLQMLNLVRCQWQVLQSVWEEGTIGTGAEVLGHVQTRARSFSQILKPLWLLIEKTVEKFISRLSWRCLSLGRAPQTLGWLQAWKFKAATKLIWFFHVFSFVSWVARAASLTFKTQTQIQSHTLSQTQTMPNPGQCLVRILGIGKNRLMRASSGAPDLRVGGQPRGSTAESDSVRAFFHTAYTKLGECLPDKFVRRGRAKAKKKVDSDSDSGGVVSDLEGEDDSAELLEWLDRSTNTEVHNAVLHAGSMVKRWLPPGNLSELYDHYQVVQSLLEINPASFLVAFLRVHKQSDKTSWGSAPLFGCTRVSGRTSWGSATRLSAFCCICCWFWWQKGNYWFELNIFSAESEVYCVWCLWAVEITTSRQISSAPSEVGNCHCLQSSLEGAVHR